MSIEENEFCEQLGLEKQEYIILKEVIIRENMRNKNKETILSYFRVDNELSSTVYDIVIQKCLN